MDAAEASGGSLMTRVMRPASISTTITEPSSIATGPSGNIRSLAISRMVMGVSPILWLLVERLA